MRPRTHNPIPRFLLLAAVASALLLPADPVSAQTTRERGLGPYTLVTSRGEATVRLLRRDRDIVWVDRLVRSGEYIETGVPKSEILAIKSERPRLFELADIATTDEQIASVIDQLRRMVAQLRPYRDLPGIPVSEAMILQARLNERRDYWRDALVIYQELMEQPYDFPDRDKIRYWSGMNLWRMDQKEKALEYLMDDPVPDDDLDTLSDILYARGDALASAERHREAIDAFLHLIVFYPYVNNNEPRALRAIIPSYIAMREWDAAVKSLDALKRDYAEAPETAEAEELMNTYAEEMSRERKFQVVVEE